MFGCLSAILQFSTTPTVFSMGGWRKRKWKLHHLETEHVFFGTWFTPGGVLSRSLCDPVLLFCCESGCRKTRNTFGLESLEKLSFFCFFLSLQQSKSAQNFLNLKCAGIDVFFFKNVAYEVQHCLPGSSNLRPVGPSVVCIVSFLWLAGQQQGQETLQCVALLQRVGSEPRPVGSGLAEGYFWGCSGAPQKALIKLLTWAGGGK